MKKIAPWLTLAALLFALEAEAKQVPVLRNTTCNIRYNNYGIVAGDVPCKAWFSPSGKLYRVKFLYPKTRSWYDWSVAQNRVESDKRWAECVRYTQPEGNQWQVCTVPSPQQLNVQQ